MTPETTLELLHSLGADTSLCGSRQTCAPVPEDSDTDILCFCRNEGVVSDVVNSLGDQGFQWEGSTEHYQQVAGSDFISMRWPRDSETKRDTINVIVTSSPEFRRRHHAATALCRELNLQSKQHRIAIFQAVLYGDRVTEEVPL